MFITEEGYIEASEGGGVTSWPYIREFHERMCDGVMSCGNGGLLKMSGSGETKRLFLKYVQVFLKKKAWPCGTQG